MISGVLLIFSEIQKTEIRDVPIIEITLNDIFKLMHVTKNGFASLISRFTRSQVYTRTAPKTATRTRSRWTHRTRPTAKASSRTCSCTTRRTLVTGGRSLVNQTGVLRLRWWRHKASGPSVCLTSRFSIMLTCFEWLFPR